MEVKLLNHSFTTSRSSYSWLSQKAVSKRVLLRNVAHLDYFTSSQHNVRRVCALRFALLEFGCFGHDSRLVGSRKRYVRRSVRVLPRASAEDGVTVNGSPQGSASSGSGVEEMIVKLDQSLEGEDQYDGLVQALHEAARVYELAIKEHNSFSRVSLFSTAWLGVDRNAWVKTLSYQASVYSLLQTTIEISSRGYGRDKDTSISVQKSLLRQSAPLESLIREKLSAKQPEASQWFWSDQIPAVVTSFVNYLEDNPNFTAATSLCVKNISVNSGNVNDIALIGLALTCIAAIIKLGPAKVSCSQFFSLIPEITGRLMDLLVDLIPIHQAYQHVKDIGLHKEFLVHFGPRAAACRVKCDQDSEEVIFWIELVQKQLQQAIDRERIWSRLTTSESIEVLERDLAVFGFFIALSRNTQSFLSANGYNAINEPLEGFIRYLVGGSILYYPQLSSISSYQLYVEVVCEELDWLPFYPGSSKTLKESHGRRSQHEYPPNAEAIPQVLDVCSHWIESFIKYSQWLKNPSNVKAVRFLSKGRDKLMECVGELPILRKDVEESGTAKYVERIEKESDSFDKALESVEEALMRLEKLLQELHVTSSGSKKEYLKAACSDLEKIRKLKKEAEFLEASFRAKTDSYQQQGDDEDDIHSSDIGRQQYLKGSYRKRRGLSVDKRKRLWSFGKRPSETKPTSEPSTEDDRIEKRAVKMGVSDSESSEIHRFEFLQNELLELEKRVQRSTTQSERYKDINLTDESINYRSDARGDQFVQVQKKESVIEKSLDKMKETSMDIWQGTQLLAVDVAAAMGLLQRVLIGDELTEKEKKALRRTLTDVASVVPIGVLMLLPVTAVGHAAILAAIQRYVPALIPSTYGAERLDLLRQLEKVKVMETEEANPEDNVEEELA